MFINVAASGTNVQRLTKVLNAVDGVIYTAYSQIEGEPGMVKRRFFRSTISQDLISEIDGVTAEKKPSWTKIWAKPMQNKAFIEKFVQGICGEDTERPQLNLSEMLGEVVNCFMLFVSTNKKEMELISKIIKQACPEWDTIILNGNYTTNREAEVATLQAINDAKVNGQKGLIIISKMMGSRSYSVSEIQATVMAYDCGSIDASTQKVSRCLTPGQLWDGSKKTTGAIVDFSFDPNRSENIERLIIDEAVMIQRSGETEDFKKAITRILSSVNMLKVDEYGVVEEVTEAELFSILGDNDTLLRVADMTVDVKTLLEGGLLDLLVKVRCYNDSKEKKVALNEGVKNRIMLEEGDEKEKKERDKVIADLQKLINRAIKSLNRSATSVYHLAGFTGGSYRDCLNAIETTFEGKEEFVEFYGITPAEAVLLLNEGVLNEAILDVIVQNSRPTEDESVF